MVIAATLVMVICMVFRIPYAFQGAIYALTVSRESSQATFKSAATILSLTGIGAAYLLASAWFVISIPTLHLLWVIASFFLGFYAISTIKNFGASSTFAIMICVGVPIWDRHVSAETNVEDTLWLLSGLRDRSLGYGSGRKIVCPHQARRGHRCGRRGPP